MSMINDIKGRLANIAATVPGIKRAYVEAPQSLPPGDLPVFISYTGAVSAFSNPSGGMGYETRQYILRLYVTQKLKGYDGESEKAVEPYLTSVRDAFLTHPGLGLSTLASRINFIKFATWQGDSGILVLPFAGEEFLGTEFKISVDTFLPVTYAPFE